MISNPTAPDIRKAPPRFIWTKKHWTVDPGRTMQQVEHIPQLQEAAVLYQSYDYNSQHAYGKRPTYDVVVNKEFRPPLIEQEDIMPLSRIPRPVIIPHINPGGAHPSGNNSFADQNIDLQDVGRFLTNRVKEGQIEPTFFCPIDVPVDNSILPDLHTNMPSYSAGAGFKYPNIADVSLNSDRDHLEPKYKQNHPERSSGLTPITFDAPNASGRENFTLDYVNPQISATAGFTTLPEFYSGDSGLTEIDLEYNKPQTSAWAGLNSISSQSYAIMGSTPDLQLKYNRPGYSAGAGTITLASGTTAPVEYNLEKKLAGSTPSDAGRNMSHVTAWDHDRAGAHIDQNKVYTVRPDVSYVIPSNTRYKDGNELKSAEPTFQHKVASLGNYQAQISQSSIPRAGISTPQLKLKGRKDA
jgi:hypothetical protein